MVRIPRRLIARSGPSRGRIIDVKSEFFVGEHDNIVNAFIPAVAAGSELFCSVTKEVGDGGSPSKAFVLPAIFSVALRGIKAQRVIR